MAQCYHDKQDFESDLNIEVAREGDILQEGLDLDKFPCKKNSGHSGFIPFKDLTVEHLPHEDRSTETLERIQKWGRLVVRLVVDKIKNGRMVTDVGSGYLYKNVNGYQIKTNNHIVKTDNEVENCTVEFFYDSHDRSNVLTSKGVQLVSTCPFRDISFFLFYPVPDFVYQLDVIEPVISPPCIVIIYKNNQIVTNRLHPHFRSLRFTYETSENLNDPQIKMMFISLGDNSISYLHSSYFKFHPIPSNIQELTSKNIYIGIDIHIDGDDGNSRVISGGVVKFDDDYVVALPKALSIFQDEVKKYRLVWNGEVIGHGTRLYFEQFPSIDFFSHTSEIDLEPFMELGTFYIWSFRFHPQPRDLDTIIKIVNEINYTGINMCCIGHPHGSIKMVTFGHYLGKSIQRFDNQYRSIDKPGKDCRCMRVVCMKYSCKTCPGSSGSPVFFFSMNFGINHFMGRKVKELLESGELIENINMAWG